MLVGALYAKSKNENAIVINAASDHIVENMPEFIKVMTAAVETAAENPYLVTVGITPSYPTSAFGYIKVGRDIKKVKRDLTLSKLIVLPKNQFSYCHRFYLYWCLFLECQYVCLVSQRT
jgi:mannose-1-phosphate guanylyltransferase